MSQFRNYEKPYTKQMQVYKKYRKQSIQKYKKSQKLVYSRLRLDR